MADVNRSRRVGELIQRELATLLSREIKDPRLALVSITGVDVTRDMGFAKVFYTVMDLDSDLTSNSRVEHEKIHNVKESLKKAAGFLRYELGKRIQLRIVPQLSFHYDESIVRGSQLSQLIDNAIKDDKKRHNPSA